MRRKRWIVGMAVLGLLGVPVAATADEPTDAGDVQEQLWLMQQKLKRMEDQLRATNQRLEQAQAYVPAEEECWICSLEIGGWVSASYFYNFEDADGRDNAGFNTGAIPAYPFKPDSNSFQLDQVWLEIEKPVNEESRAGFRLDFVFGKTADILNGSFDGFSGSDEDFHLYQGYIQYLAPIGPGVQFQFGKFATLIGAEVAQATGNFNITRGHVYNLFQPITHTGLLASVEPWDGGSLSVGFVNETRSFPASDIDLNNNKAVLWQIGHALSETVSVSLAGVHGDSDSGQGIDTRDGDNETIVDLIIAWNPNDQFSSYINADYINSENSVFGNSDTEGYGIAAAGRYALTDTLGFALRGEWVDLDGNTNPRELQIWGLTSTVDYTLATNLVVRGELRYDSVRPGDLDNLFFDSRSSIRGIPRSGQSLTEDDQVTAGLEVIYSF